MSVKKKKQCRNEPGRGLGYYPTGSRYNGKLYRDTAGDGHAIWVGGLGHDTMGDCIVTGNSLS